MIYTNCRHTKTPQTVASMSKANTVCGYRDAEAKLLNYYQYPFRRGELTGWGLGGIEPPAISFNLTCMRRDSRKSRQNGTKHG